MQCNLLYLIINLLIIYEKIILIITTNVTTTESFDDDDIVYQITTPSQFIDEITTSPTKLNRLTTISPPNTTTEELGLEISRILNGFFSSGYDKRVRPNYGAKPVDVGVTMFVISISSVSEVQMDFTSDFYFRQYWKDNRLSFPPSNGITQIFVGAEVSDKIWVPDTFIANEKSAYFHIATTANTFLRITSEGEVLRSIRLTVTASCPMDLQYFPMDRQLCAIEIESYGYSMSDIKYKWQPVANSVGLSKELSLPQFKVLGHRQKEKVIDLTTGNYSRLICEIQFARSLGFYLIQIYIPASLIVVISWVSFWLHRNATPARVSLGVTTVLTMTTLMSSTNSQLPKISYIKSIDVFLGTCFVMVFGSLLEYAIVGYFGKRISMRKSRSEQLNKAISAKADAELKQSNLSNQFHSMYNQPNASYQQLRSPSFYNQQSPFTLNNSPNMPNIPNMSNVSNLQNTTNTPNIPSILIENSNNINNNSNSNINNEPIYNENTLHPPSLPSLPSNEHIQRYLPPRSHSADNYIHQHSNNDSMKRFNQQQQPIKFSRSPPSNTHDNKFIYPPFNHHSDYYFNIPPYYPPFQNPYNHNYLDRNRDFFNDHPYSNHQHQVSNLPSSSINNLQAPPLNYLPYHHSMSYANKFNHYPYLPAYYNAPYPYYQPFYPDYHKPNFIRQSSEPLYRQNNSYLDYDHLNPYFMNSNSTRYPTRNRLNTQLNSFDPVLEESRYSKYAAFNKQKQSLMDKKIQKSNKLEDDEELLLQDQIREQQQQNQQLKRNHKDQQHLKQNHHQQELDKQQLNYNNDKNQLNNNQINKGHHYEQKLSNKMVGTMENKLNDSGSLTTKTINRQQLNERSNNDFNNSGNNRNLNLNLSTNMHHPSQQQQQITNQQNQKLIDSNLLNQRPELNQYNNQMNQMSSINQMNRMNSINSINSKQIKSSFDEPLNLTTQLTNNQKTATITATSYGRSARFNRLTRSFLAFGGCNNPNKICGLSPSDIDKYSRVIFPVCFICFNLMYWIIYLHISTDVKADLVPLGG